MVGGGGARGRRMPRATTHGLAVCCMQSKLPLISPWILAKLRAKLRSALGSSEDTWAGMLITYTHTQPKCIITFTHNLLASSITYTHTQPKCIITFMHNLPASSYPALQKLVRNTSKTKLGTAIITHFI
jgi:hypothetical protein